jgi:hypothetical protein
MIDLVLLHSVWANGFFIDCEVRLGPLVLYPTAPAPDNEGDRVWSISGVMFGRGN